MIRKCNMPAMPDGTPEEVKRVVSSIWVLDPAARPTMAQLCTQLFAIMRTYRPPSADKFSLNSIPGVSRAAVDAPITVRLKILRPANQAQSQRCSRLYCGKV
ncbi:unnamed protein product [Nippostrongylus brasiliensis]|uniref:PK_Tyr_Ser-Thr domain-containing protein n=1 Tax=Nippostrongylus brasiliensis TaxID=27835 RepID=A0A0N4YIH9_NIPBR|nr:unnamed protein product [Nippostrongylus brasiliensis]